MARQSNISLTNVQKQTRRMQRELGRLGMPKNKKINKKMLSQPRQLRRDAHVGKTEVATQPKTTARLSTRVTRQSEPEVKAKSASRSKRQSKAAGRVVEPMEVEFKRKEEQVNVAKTRRSTRMEQVQVRKTPKSGHSGEMRDKTVSKSKSSKKNRLTLSKKGHGNQQKTSMTGQAQEKKDSSKSKGRIQLKSQSKVKTKTKSKSKPHRMVRPARVEYIYANLPLVVPKKVRSQSRYFTLRNSKNEPKGGEEDKKLPSKEPSERSVLSPAPDHKSHKSSRSQRSEQSSDKEAELQRTARKEEKSPSPQIESQNPPKTARTLNELEALVGKREGRIFLLSAEREGGEWRFKVKEAKKTTSFMVTLNEELLQCSCIDFRVSRKGCGHTAFIVGKLADCSDIMEDFARSKEMKREHFIRLDNSLVPLLKNRLNVISKEEQDGAKEDSTCSICFGALEAAIEPLGSCPSCKSTFHSMCLHQWSNKNNTCPLCREQLRYEDRNPRRRLRSGRGAH